MKRLDNHRTKEQIKVSIWGESCMNISINLMLYELKQILVIQILMKNEDGCEKRPSKIKSCPALAPVPGSCFDPNTYL